MLVSDVFVKNMNLRNFRLSSYAKVTDKAELEQKGKSLCFTTSHFLYVCILSPITFLRNPGDPGPSYFSSKLNSVKAWIFSKCPIYLAYCLYFPGEKECSEWLVTSSRKYRLKVIELISRYFDVFPYLVNPLICLFISLTNIYREHFMHKTPNFYTECHNFFLYTFHLISTIIL